MIEKNQKYTCTYNYFLNSFGPNCNKKEKNGLSFSPIFHSYAHPKKKKKVYATHKIIRPLALNLLTSIWLQKLRVQVCLDFVFLYFQQTNTLGRINRKPNLICYSFCFLFSNNLFN